MIDKCCEYLKWNESLYFKTFLCLKYILKLIKCYYTMQLSRLNTATTDMPNISLYTRTHSQPNTLIHMY